MITRFRKWLAAKLMIWSAKLDPEPFVKVRPMKQQIWEHAILGIAVEPVNKGDLVTVVTKGKS